MVSEYLNRLDDTLQFCPPFFECSYHCQQLLVIYFVVAFGWGMLFPEEGDWVKYSLVISRPSTEDDKRQRKGIDGDRGSQTVVEDDGGRQKVSEDDGRRQKVAENGGRRQKVAEDGGTRRTGIEGHRGCEKRLG